MSQLQNEVKIYSSSITDRGLNERRPLNEDSVLVDNERCIFAVADGVGGSEAGEVASQTAVEVLNEAFRHQLEGADIEDLMELAIQRANASINRMSHEHAKLAMMATTIVALHLNGKIATIGHVGDSRLYRLDPSGTLVRETEDHSIVEEEVRAGRMTAEQAAHHPSKNVISRALGAEETAEVDLKTIEVKDGTCFLLCSDGITRHIPDNEIRGVLVRESDLAAACAELKRRCFERGAEDNLSAVIVRVGEPADFASSGYADPTLENAPAVEDFNAQQAERSFAGNLDLTEEAPLIPPSRIAFPPPSESPNVAANPISAPVNLHEKRSSGSAGRFFVFLLFVICAAGAFYAGARFHDRLPPAFSKTVGLGSTAESPPAAQPSPVNEDPWVKFEKARREVDRAPAEWLKTVVPKELARLSISSAIDSTDPEFLYLYGRASLLSGNIDEAAKALEQAVVRADASPSAANATIKKEAALALGAMSLKSGKDAPRALVRIDEIVAKPAATNSP
jgi:serine/threonine protein phosphatase PrpC